MLCGNDGGLGVRFSFYSHPEISCKDYCHNRGPTSSRAKKATDSAAITAASLGVTGQVIEPRPILHRYVCRANSRYGKRMDTYRLRMSLLDIIYISETGFRYMAK